MIGLTVQNPFPVFFDNNNELLENGYIYIGESGLNPEVHPVSTYWDKEFLYPAAQPVRTINGMPARSGTPSAIYAKQVDYSIKILDKNNKFIFSSLTISEVGNEYIDYLKPLESIAELRLVDASLISDGQFIGLKGYYADGDGGGGSFYWDATSTETDNSGTIIKATGVVTGRWKRLYSGPVNIKWFGAVVDGAADDTSEIAAALLVGDIRIDGPTISDSTTQTAYVGIGSVKTTGAAYNRAFVKVAHGDNEKTTIPVSAVIRQDTASSGWYFIDDAGHRPNGFSAIARDTDGSILLTYNFKSTKIGDLLAVSDEGYASQGIGTGSSVGDEDANIYCYKTMAIYINNATLGVAHSAYFGAKISAVDNSDGTITVTHPLTASSTQNPVLSAAYTGVNPTNQIPMLLSNTTVDFTYGMFAPFSGYIFYDGADWQVVSSMQNDTDIVVTTTASGFRVTHELLRNGVVTLTDRSGPYIAQCGAFSTTFFEMDFRSFAGALIGSTPDINMRVYFSGSDMVLQKTPKGYVSVFREQAFVDADDLFGAGANIWIGGTFEV